MTTLNLASKLSSPSICNHLHLQVYYRDFSYIVNSLRFLKSLPPHLNYTLWPHRPHLSAKITIKPTLIDIIMDHKVVVKVPECYVPHVPIPRLPVTDDSEDFGLESDSSSGATGSEKDDNTRENKVNIRAGPILRPRAVISSPDNDILLGNRNKSRDGRRLSASKNDAVLQNRHVQCKVKSREVIDNPPDTRKHMQPGSKEKIDPVEKKKVHKGNKKFENVPWKF